MKIFRKEVNETMASKKKTNANIDKVNDELTMLDKAAKILEKAFGATKSELLLKKMTASLRSNGPFEFVKSMDATKIAQLIKNEHPQTIALILYNIKYQQAATVISLLSKIF